jgi:hypothetical protein
MQLGQQLGSGTIGEMPARSRNSALNDWGVPAHPELDLIVVGFKHDGREIA